MILLPRFLRFAAFFFTLSNITTALPSPNPQESTDPPKPPNVPFNPATLPPPTGPHTVGTTTLILTDSSRLESLSPTPNITSRIFVTQIWYPTLSSSNLNPQKYKLSPYLTPGLARFTEESYMLPPGSLDVISTNSYVDTPVVLPKGKGKPVDIVIFSPGYGGSRSIYQTYHEELASWGYIVVAIEHLYDTLYVDIPGLGEFWNKYQNMSVNDPEYPGIEAEVAEMHAVRVDDGVFILKSLQEENSELVKGLERLFAKGQGSCDIKSGSKKGKSWWWGKNARVAMYGHSLGGSTSAGVMLVNPTKTKLLGGINLDGTFYGPAQTPGTKEIKSPFLVWGAPTHNSTSDESWKSFLDTVAKGWKREISLVGAAHNTFTDSSPLVELFGLRSLFPKQQMDALVGTINGVKAVQIVRKVVVGFMGWVVRGEKAGWELLNGDFHELPEVVIV